MTGLGTNAVIRYSLPNDAFRCFFKALTSFMDEKLTCLFSDCQARPTNRAKLSFELPNNPITLNRA